MLNVSCSSFFVLLTVLAMASSQAPEKVITVSNGGTEGQWGPLERCPPGAKAVGFQTRKELATPFFDDTALNTIVLICNDENLTNFTSTPGL
jgi:Vitelline membrane outer layer protein I (VOMI)